MKTRDSAVDLNRQLDAYAAVAKLPERNSRSRWGKWTTYAAATGAALASASAASADIFYSGPVDFSGSNVFAQVGGGSLLTGTNPAKGILFNAFKRRIGHLNSSTSYYGAHHAAESIWNETLVGGGQGLHALFFGSFAPGAPISGNANQLHAFVDYVGEVRTHGGHVVTAPDNFGLPGHISYQPSVVKRTLLLGFETYRSGVIPGGFGNIPGPEVGWVRVQFDTNWPGTFEIFDYAYNTDGPIDAGQTSATPEPNYLPLMLLAGGATGVLAWKRRRSRPAPDA
jgi:hypothetical protein